MELHDEMVQKMLNGTPMEFDSDLARVEFERDSWIRRACSAEKVLSTTSATVSAQEKTLAQQAERIAELEKQLRKKHGVTGLFDAVREQCRAMSPLEALLCGVGVCMLFSFSVYMIFTAVMLLS